jgi:hypothetical protein
MDSQVSFRVITRHGIPVRKQQVIVRVSGRFEYAITDATGLANFPFSTDQVGKVIILGRTRYLGGLEVQEIILN